MQFTVNINEKSLRFDKKVALLDLIDAKDPLKKDYVCARVNNRLRELNYEVYYDSTVEFLTVKDHGAMKIYEASLRYIVAMAFHNLYPNLHIRFAYNVSRCVSIHLLDPKVSATTAMLIKIEHEIRDIVKADYPLKRLVVSNAEA